MFREMRRKKQLLAREIAQGILERGNTGVLAVLGDNGYPYTVPLNYVCKENALYFHCAKAGHKLDAIRNDDKVSFCVIDKEEIVPEEFTTYFRSVIVFGRAMEVEEGDEKREAMRFLHEKYAPGLSKAGDEEIRQEWNALAVVKIQIEHISGKEAIELVNQNK